MNIFLFQFLRTALVVNCVLLTFSCSTKESRVSKETNNKNREIKTEEAISNSPAQAETNLQKGIVKDITGLDGCSFVIQINDSTRLLPENLPQEFMKDNLPVQLKYKFTNKMNVCMAGRTVRLEKIILDKK